MNFNENETSRKIKSLVSKPTKYKKKCGLWIFRIVLILIVAIGVSAIGCGLGVFHGILSSAPDIDEINVLPSGFSSVIYNQQEVEIQKLSNYESNREEVSLNQVPVDLQNAFIAIEDSRFYEHNGIDLKGIVRAGFLGLTSGDFSQGASTITQQLLKNNVFGVGGEDSTMERIERKIQEQYLAIELEKRMTKKEILEAYLNTINLGEGTLGVQSASKTYFDKEVAELNLSECAVLAAITQNPTKYNPITNPNNNATRRAIVLQYMLDDGMITEEEYTEAITDDVYTRIQEVNQKKSSTSTSYSYFVDALIKEVVTDLEEKLGYNETQAYNALYSDGLQIYSTQDTGIQNICDNEFKNEDNFKTSSFSSVYALSYQFSVLTAKGETINYSEADVARFLGYASSDEMFFTTKKEGRKAVKNFRKSVMKEDYTILGENISLTLEPQLSYSMIDQSNGYVVALVGGRGQKSGNLTLNRATDTTKQPGSTFKVLSTFVPALDTAGITLGTVYDDCPYNYENSSKPVNNYYSSGYRGLNTVRDAIRDSMNIITAKCMADVTPQVGYDYLLNMGFTTLVEKEVGSDGTVYSDIQQSLCLGGITKGVTNLELTAGYTTIANKGTYNKPILYTKILDHDGNVLIDNTSESKQVMKESTAWLLTNAMKDVVSSGTGTAARLSTPMAVAGKTGTTSNDYDHWFVGFTPYYTAGIWCGYDSNRTFLTGGVEKHLWAKIMNEVNEYKGLTAKDFDACKGITSCSICRKCGKLAVKDLCSKDPRGTMIRTEYYASGTEPTEKCDCHTKVKICKDSGLPASEYCPKSHTETKVYITRPKDSKGTTADSKYELPEDFQDQTCNVHTTNSILNENNTNAIDTPTNTTQAAPPEITAPDGTSTTQP